MERVGFVPKIVADEFTGTTATNHDDLRTLPPEPLRNPNHWTTTRIPIDSINVFSQPRKKFDGIEDLALNIAHNGILNPQDVGMYSYDQAVEHIRLVNKIWNTNHTPEELTGMYEDKYPILLAGERRTRAERVLATKGCSECQKEFGEGSCIERHFGDRNTDIRFKPLMTVREGLRIQASENIHRRLPPAQEADYYTRYFNFQREEKPELSLTDFAKTVGRSSDYVRNALRYTSLPEGIRILVEGSQIEGDSETVEGIKFGIALELARLQSELGINEEGLLWWATQSVGKKVADFRSMVTNFINQEKSGQTLMQILTDSQEEEARRSAFRRTVEPTMVMGIHEFIRYMNSVNGLIQAGVLSKGIESPYSPKSPRNIIMKMVGVLERSLPELQRILTKKELEKVSDVTGKAHAVLSLFDDTDELNHEEITVWAALN